MDQVLLQEGVPPDTAARVQVQVQAIVHLPEAPQEGVAVIVAVVHPAEAPAEAQVAALVVALAEAVVPEVEDKQFQITKN